MKPFEVDIFTGEKHVTYTILAISSVQATLTAIRMMSDEDGIYPLGIICKLQVSK